MPEVIALILAAGEGKRMRSNKAKVIHEVCGKPMIEWVYEAAQGAGASKCVAIVGHGAEQVMDTMGSKVDYVLQEQQLGTGHAVKQAYKYYTGTDNYILVLYGDTPLITTKTILSAINFLKNGNYKAVVISADMSDPYGYGRIVRDERGSFLRIVEQRDTNEEQKSIKEINSGMYIFSSRELAEALCLLTNNNDQKEYYLTDTLEIILSKGSKVGVYKADDSDEVLGVNDQEQLKIVSSIMEKRLNSR